jgi:hypothetical protein
VRSSFPISDLFTPVYAKIVAICNLNEIQYESLKGNTLQIVFSETTEHFVRKCFFYGHLQFIYVDKKSKDLRPLQEKVLQALMNLKFDFTSHTPYTKKWNSFYS